MCGLPIAPGGSSVVLDLNGLDERVAEIDESLCRQQLNKLEESEQLAERK